MSFPLQIIRPIIFFDLETTGLDFKYDRIIEIGAIKVFPDGREEKLHRRVNPGMRIPAEVSAITGIKNEDVAQQPTFSQMAREIELFFSGADLAGYNVNRFDAKVMVEEFKRVGLDFKLEARAVIDGQVIFHQKEKRDLSAAYKFYCGKDLTDAHSAQADTEATYRIILAQIEKYTDLPKDIQALHAFCRGDQERFVDSEGKFFWRDGEAVFNFGKYKSRTLKEVCKTNPEYLDWVMSPERNFGQDVVDLCYKALKGEFPVKKSAVI